MGKVYEGRVGSGVTWRNFRVVQRNISLFGPKVDLLIAAKVEYIGAERMGYAKQKAPWTDRTSNARNGLLVEFDHVPMKKHGFALYHSVPYGIFLETRWSGKYSIINNTLKGVMPKLIAQIRSGIAALR